MKTAAIIAEYNPFHNGHAYQLSEVRKRSEADFLIILMSGDFVQRGTPALFDKYVRTEAALACGADLVLELPVTAATGSAARFAEGAVAILDGLGMVDELWFGSEEGNLDRFDQITDVLVDEPAAYQNLLKEWLKKGDSYPAARSKALGTYLAGSYDDAFIIEEFMKAPNNILGLEYILALKKRNSKIKACTLKRIGEDYHSTASSEFSSATAIRAVLKNQGSVSDIGNMVPESALSLYKETIRKSLTVIPEALSSALQYQLWKESKESLCRILDVNEELANRILNLRPRYIDFESFAELLQTRNQTKTAMQRCLLHILLGITWKDAEWIKEIRSDKQLLVRMLGMSLHAREGKLLSAIDKDGPIVITANPASHPLQEQYEKDLFASSYYESLRILYTEEAFIPEYSRKLIVK